jgi:hypothetical protein
LSSTEVKYCPKRRTTLINITKQLSFKGFSLTGQKVPRKAHFIQY